MSAQTVNIPQGGAGFDDALQDALRQCLLLSDYDQATARWYQMTRMLRKAGCPQEVIDRYEDKLLEYFEQKQHAEDAPYGQVIKGNVGTLNIYQGKREVPMRKTITTQQIATAYKQCLSYTWGKSSLASIFRVCVQYYGLADNRSQFERDMSKAGVECPSGTLNSAFQANAYLPYPIEQWPEKGAKERVMILVDAFCKAVEGTE